MPRPRLPTAIHEIKGTYLINSERRPKAEPKGAAVLGPVPRELGDLERVAWGDIVQCALPGVLTPSDRLVVELAARLLADMRGSPEIKPAVAARLAACLGRLGMTPADRTRV